MMDRGNWLKPMCYAARHKDETVRVSSRSGGIFTAISDYVLDRRGVVYGCILTGDFMAMHIRSESKVGRNMMRGSKYIQSKMGNIYKDVKDDLDNYRYVLFTGTSCQIAGLRSFLGKEYNNLLCVDIVCHGVPSPVVWKSYLKWQEKKYKAKVEAVEFRNKKDFGWRDHVETMKMNDGQRISSSIFKELFYGHNVLRPCCYECPYKSVIHPGDITIADYWGIENAAPEFDDNKGVSLVLVNNDKGISVFKKIKKDVFWKSTKLEDSMQPPLIAPFEKPRERDKFWNDFNRYKFEYIAGRYGNGKIRYLKEKIKRIKSKIMVTINRMGKL